jgi:alkylated DNA repair protein (DNA oxidative demethylase)
MRDLLSELPPAGNAVEILGPGATLLRGFARDEAPALLDAIAVVAAAAPFRRMVTPGGFTMLVAMTNCGAAGWVTDRKGYRYTARDPETGQTWPPIPAPLLDLATRAAAAGSYPGFAPDACLVNRYEPGTRLTLHQDRNERDAAAPIVSVSLGLPANFLWGGASRSDRPRRVRLESGDIAVWGGPTRMNFHGIDVIAEGEDPLTGRYRYNLTFRKAL